MRLTVEQANALAQVFAEWEANQPAFVRETVVYHRESLMLANPNMGPLSANALLAVTYMFVYEGA